MAFDTVDEILEAVKAKETELSALRTQMQDDFSDLYTLAAYEAEDGTGKKRKGYQSYTSSAPRNFFDKVLDGLNRAELSIQIKLPENASEKARRAASLGELYLFGALAAVDRRQAKRGEPPLRESLGFLGCARGWLAMRALVYTPKGKEAETVFDVQPWDLLHITWEVGDQGLLWAANKRQVTKSQVKAEYGIDTEKSTAEIIDFWDEEKNSVIIGGEFAKLPTPHNIKHVPVYIGSVGSMPTLQSSQVVGASTTESLIEYRGNSVWTAARGLYKPFNRAVSKLMDVQERSVAGSLIHKSKDGTKKIEGDPYLTFRVIPLEEGEEITALELPKAPPETAAILGIIEKDIQQSTLPYPLAYGGTAQAMSGRALSVLADATRSVYSPRTALMAQAYTWLAEELLTQFANKGIKPVTLKGYKEDGNFFVVKAKPSEIDTDWFVSVKVEPRLPRDKEAEIMMALAATQRRGPDQQALMSMDTAREELIHMRDPNAESDKVLSEMGESLPPIIAANIAAALKRRGEDELAEQVLMLLKPPGAQGGGGGGEAAPPLPPQLIEAIVRALAESGQREIAMAFLAALGIAPPQGRPQPGMMPTQQQGVLPPVEGPPPGMMR